MLRRLLPAAALIALAVPAGAAARTVNGTVVDRGHHGHRFTVADCRTGATTTLRSHRRAPRTGARVRVAAHRRGGSWVAARIRRHGSHHGACSVEGTVTAVDTAARTVTIATEDRGTDQRRSLIVSVPAALRLSRFTVGDDVELRLVAHRDGTLVLKGLDDEDQGDQGDDHGDDGPGHDLGDDHGDDGVGHDHGDAGSGGRGHDDE